MSNVKRPSILVVDDTPANLGLLANLLRDQYQVRVANSGRQALELAFAIPPNLILLDIMMPEMDGHEVIRRLKADPRTARVPVIFLTAQNSIEDEELGLKLGAVDFIHKPISPPIVMARINTQLQVKSWQDFMQDQNDWLQQEVDRRLAAVNRLQNASIWVMVSLAESRDSCTGNHIRRTQEYIRILAEEMAHLPQYADVLTEEYIELIAKTAPLHDLGKIAIPDQILNKPGKLTEEEYAIMKTHALRGDEMLARAGKLMGEEGDYFEVARQIARSHHEKWNGSGYPDGHAGAAIPLPARLAAVVDVYDALVARRSYKEPMPHAHATVLLERDSGHHFDPDIIAAFKRVQDRFRGIAAQWEDR
ncbi:MAG: response regulator [Sideroxydans sp.]|nr:response regulator [Sideroxydans sp.]